MFVSAKVDRNETVDTHINKLLEKNIVFIDLYDSAANNTVLECIIRNTPLIVNRTPGVVEYLGEDYPLYFDNLDEVDGLLELEKLSVETRPVLTGNFVAQPAMQRIGEELPNPKEFVTANLISETTFLVSCHHELTNDQIDYLCESLKSVALKHKD